MLGQYWASIGPFLSIEAHSYWIMFNKMKFNYTPRVASEWINNFIFMKLSLKDHELPNKRLPTVAIQYNKGRFFWQWILHLIDDIF